MASRRPRLQVRPNVNRMNRANSSQDKKRTVTSEEKNSSELVIKTEQSNGKSGSVFILPPVEMSFGDDIDATSQSDSIALGAEEEVENPLSPVSNMELVEEHSQPPQSPTKSGRKSRSEKETKSRRAHGKIREPPERSKMTMVDLIYWNPPENPMKSSAIKKLPVEDVESPTSRQEISDSPELAVEDESCAPAPKLKIGANGEIMLDEESLYIEHAKPEGYSVVHEETSSTNYSSFRNRPSFRRWSVKETVMFYKALSVVGTDFALMSNLIPNRARHELKLKFKREEKRNRDFVDKIMSNPSAYELERFEEELEEMERSLELDKPVKKKKKVIERIYNRPLSQEDSRLSELVEAQRKGKRGRQLSREGSCHSESVEAPKKGRRGRPRAREDSCATKSIKAPKKIKRGRPKKEIKLIYSISK